MKVHLRHRPALPALIKGKTEEKPSMMKVMALSLMQKGNYILTALVTTARRETGATGAATAASKKGGPNAALDPYLKIRRIAVKDTAAEVR